MRDTGNLLNEKKIDLQDLPAVVMDKIPSRRKEMKKRAIFIVYMMADICQWLQVTVLRAAPFRKYSNIKIYLSEK